jgi:YebC/PmpR family DNA-binding regulatory protein
MSGHSKWATTKHRKGAVDAKRSALFSKLTRIITVAAKTGGDPSPENNASLAAAIAKAKSYSLPKDKIDTAIKKAFGAGADAANYDEVIYEGYGPAGVALYVESLTDNRNRTAADVRAAFTRAGGNLGATGSVAFQFERKGEIVIEKSVASDEDELMLLVADAGGEDLEDNDEEWVVYTVPNDLMSVSKALENAGVAVKGAELVMEATTPQAIAVEDAKKVMRLVDRLEELDDIQNVYTTMEMTEEIAAALDA